MNLPAYPLLRDYPQIVPEITGTEITSKELTLQCRFPVVNDSRVQYDVRWYLGNDLKQRHTEKVIVDPLEVAEAYSSLPPGVRDAAGIKANDMNHVCFMRRGDLKLLIYETTRNRYQFTSDPPSPYMKFLITSTCVQLRICYVAHQPR